MKHILTLILLVALCTLGLSAAKKGEVDVTFSSTVYDFGTVTDAAGAQTHEFVMTNNGTEPVAILSATTSCGCTRPEHSRKPVMPGDSTVIRVSFLPAGQRGAIMRDVKLRLRSAASKKSTRRTLKIQGNVLPK